MSMSCIQDSEGYTYQNIATVDLIACNILPRNTLDDIPIPDNCQSADADQQQFMLIFKTGVTCDGTIVDIKFLIDTEREYDDPRMSANSYKVLLMYVQGIELLNGVYGLHHSDRMDVMLVNRLLKIASATKLCFGKEVEITEPTSVLEKHTWKTHQGGLTFTFACLQSKQCKVIMGFTTSLANNVCSKCIKDIR